MEIQAVEFSHQEPIPSKFTCQGKNVSPHLKIIDPPKETKSFALIMDDPDAPQGTFDHWIMWNIPPNNREFPEGVKLGNHGVNGYGVLEYRGPCPPPGKIHHYYFTLYALNTTLKLPDGSTKTQVKEAMQGHILEKHALIGTFQR